jgi:putative transposase
MVTAGTYRKQPFFAAPDRLDYLCDSLLNACEKFNWQLQAWAVFPNHYHFVAISPSEARNLIEMTKSLHSVTAREMNRLDATEGRKVWYQYWETHLTYQKSYLARLSYVHHNAVHHGLARVPSAYRWCSASCFERKASPAFFKTVTSFRWDRLKVMDDFSVEAPSH